MLLKISLQMKGGPYWLVRLHASCIGSLAGLQFAIHRVTCDP
jgi:hypothetical protein